MKLWGGRFSQTQNTLAAQYNDSLPFDYRLAEEDVIGSQAWVKGLLRANILTGDEASRLLNGLDEILNEFRQEVFQFHPGDEDIHTAVERRLIEVAGSVAGKLHTGRSRNDQVATDFRLWIQKALRIIHGDIRKLQTSLVDRAEKDFDIIMPGYTHTQRAQPILFSHWWLSHFWPLQRDIERLEGLSSRASIMPLGSSALAGTPFAVDRSRLAKELGFSRVSENSLDAVSDRDFAVEFLFFSTMIAVHLSKLADQLILFSTSEYGFIELSDAYSTGSSLMPQKKNADPLELTRGKTGTLIGLLAGLLATLKGLPSAYDKDLQEDKLPVFQAFDTLSLMLPVTAGLIDELIIHPARIAAALDPSLLATDLADYLVEKGVPFREAHTLAGQVVRRGIELQINLDKMPLHEFQIIYPGFQADVMDVFDFKKSVAKRKEEGGTSPEKVREQIQKARNIIELN